MFGMKSQGGAGLTKEQASRRNYFDIFSRHFRHIVGASFLYALSNLLFFGASFALFAAYFSGDNFVKIAQAFLSGKSFVFPILPFLPLMLTGPFTAGFTYVIRNYAKQEHTFLFSDFFEHAKKNWKQALITSILAYLVMYLVVQALIVYNSIFVASGLPLGVLYTLFFVVCTLLTILFFYVYPMMVTFRMSLKTIFKNAWAFTIMKLPQNIIIFALLLLINGGLFYVTTLILMLPELFFILLVFLLTGFTSYTANYYIWHVLNKHIVQYVTKKDEDERIFVDEEHMEDYDDTEASSDYDDTI